MTNPRPARVRRLVRRSLPVAAIAALVVGATACNSPRVLGEVRNPHVAIERDGAASVLLGGRVFWAFGDTIAPGGWVRSSGAYADVASPTEVTDTLVADRPLPLVPLTAAEEADDRAATDGSVWVIWPSSMVSTGPDRALVFSSKFRATPNGWVDQRLVVSDIVAGETQSRRLAEPIGAPSGNYATGIYAQGGYVYLHDCGGANLAPELVTSPLLAGLGGSVTALNPTPGLCRLARVPIGDVADGSAYRYWSGVAWSPVAATAIGVVPGSNSGLSVAWNDDLGSYVSVSTPGLSKDVQLSTAPAPEGPWSSPRTIHTEVTGIYATRIHPELGTSGANRIVVSYFRQDQPDRKGAVVLLELPVS